MIEIKGVSLSFDSLSLFEHFNLSVGAGEKVGISGASGKGKTTLLKMIFGYQLPQIGEIIVNKLAVNECNIAAIRRQIAWIPQNVNLPVDNGKQLAEWLGLVKNDELIGAILSKLGLDDSFLNKDFSQISGGQKQRVLLAVCFALPKNILLIDEPTSALDDDAIVLLTNYLKSLSGKTVLAASHNAPFLRQMDRIVAL